MALTCSTFFLRKEVALAVSAFVLGSVSFGASAAPSITPLNDVVTAPGILTSALLMPGSGITIVGPVIYQGTNDPTLQQSGTYTGFNLPPSSGSGPTFTIADGIFLTSGSANIPLTNTFGEFTNLSGSGPNAQLSALSGTVTNDANALTFSFTVAPTNNSVSAMFLFGTEEFPNEPVTDIFGFFVDGVNYAKFPNGALIANNGSTNFTLNPVGSGLYDIEYNGLSSVLNVTGLLDNTLTTHTITIGIADTSDGSFDSGVFLARLAAGIAGGGGGIGPPSTVPEPGSLALMGIALAMAAHARRRARRDRN